MTHSKQLVMTVEVLTAKWDNFQSILPSMWWNTVQDWDCDSCSSRVQTLRSCRIRTTVEIAEIAAQRGQQGNRGKRMGLWMSCSYRLRIGYQHLDNTYWYISGTLRPCAILRTQNFACQSRARIKKSNISHVKNIFALKKSRRLRIRTLWSCICLKNK